MIQRFIRGVLALYLVVSVSAISDDFTGNLLDNIEDIKKIIQNEDHASSFLEVLHLNPQVAIEQAVVGLIRTDLNTALTTGQLCELHGYKYEIHYITTEDGYILRAYRIYNSTATNNKNSRDPILLVHGLLLSSSSWVINGDQSLGFYLADQGMEVWALNSRGTTESTNHTVLHPFIDLDFWNFTFIEMGTKDIPAAVAYIKRETHYDKISVLGYSRGTLALLSYLSLTPEAANDFDLIYLVAPVGFLANVDGIANALPRLPLTNSILGSLRLPFPPAIPLFNVALVALCTLTITEPICSELYNGYFNSDSPQVDVTKLQSFVSTFDTTSFKDIVHFLQSIEKDHVHLYDHGQPKNLQVYGSKEPPALPYHRVNSSRIILFSALNDQLAKQINVQKLRNSFSIRPLVDHIVTFPKWSHIDFIFGKEAKKYFCEPVYRLYQMHSENAKGLNRRRD